MKVRAAAIAEGEIVARLARSLSVGGSERQVLEELFDAIDRVAPGAMSGIGCGVRRRPRCRPRAR